YAAARGMQKTADGGLEAWRTDPKEVAMRFMDEFTGWGNKIQLDGNSFDSGLELQEPKIEGSEEAGWTATVSFRRFRVTESGKVPSGDTDTLHMIGLKGTEHPAWFVSNLASPQMHIAEPSDGQAISSPVKLSGRGVGYESTIVVEVKDDRGRSLGKGFVNGGSTEVAPFTGSQPFSKAASPSGVVMLRPDQGAEGPPFSISIVRIHFLAVNIAPGTSGDGKQVTLYYLAERSGQLYLAKEVHRVDSTPRIATAALEELIHGSPHNNQNSTPFPKSSQVLSITISSRVATVDWSADVLEASVGAEAEALGIQSVVWTLTEFSTVSKVRFTVEGKQSGKASNGRVIEDWWGHVGLKEQPFARETSLHN
ncbi:MAG: GerMN domain-containing protein, partial [Actinomycetota bacterium]